jgi:hypothetical protein
MIDNAFILIKVNMLMRFDYPTAARARSRAAAPGKRWQRHFSLAAIF